MIIRILGEGQFSLDESRLGELNIIDNRIVDHVTRGDQDGYRKDLARMIAMVKELGNLISDEEIVPSDIIIPPADLSFEEAEDIFCHDGLIEG
ncbi:MAG TPA: hypothetical protein PKZ03_01620 [Methanothrix sp.]|jgi:hypothetical protein|uniref:PspA-associated protein PspAA n=1 Tax=Methanothrix sp. TaxID=90426 RepID=UPI001BD27EB2|nr:hypothetical protein [Methanothrix sp.]